MKTLLLSLLFASLVGCTRQQPPPQRPAQSEGTTNSVQAPVPQSSSAQKVAEGRALLEANQLDQAEQKLREAIRQDPTNQAANYYLNVLAEKKRAH